MPASGLLCCKNVEEVPGWVQALGIRVAPNSSRFAGRTEALLRPIRMELGSELVSFRSEDVRKLLENEKDLTQGRKRRQGRNANKRVLASVSLRLGVCLRALFFHTFSPVGSLRANVRFGEFWRRGESNPRPRSPTVRSLHAYLVRFPLSLMALRNGQ